MTRDAMRAAPCGTFPRVTTTTEPRLPTNPAHFAALVRAARTEDQREALWRRIIGEFKQYDSIIEPGPREPRAARTPAGRLFERRLLEFIRTPAVIRSINELDASHGTSWQDLVSLRSRPFGAMLRRWTRHQHPRVAEEAAHHIAWMGLDADRGWVLRILTRKASGRTARTTWKTRKEIATGLTDAANDNRLSATYRRAAFDAILRLFTGPESTVVSNSVDEAFSELAGALIALDPRRGPAALTDPRVLRPDTTAAWALTHQLNLDRDDRPGAYKKPIDPTLLWPVYDALRDGRLRLPGGTSEDPEQRIRGSMGNILTLAADGDPIRTTRECRAMLAGPKKKWDPLRNGAQVALRRCRKIPEAFQLLQRYWKATLGRGGKERKSPFGPDATKVIEAYALYDHFLSDGLDCYFGNMGWHWRRAITGLDLIGAHAAARLIREAAKIAEASGPLRDGRSASNWSKATFDKLERLDKRFDPFAPAIQSAVERYIARHSGDFAI